MASTSIANGDNAAALTYLRRMQALVLAKPDATASTGDGMRWDRAAVQQAIESCSRSATGARGIQNMRQQPVRTSAARCFDDA